MLWAKSEDHAKELFKKEYVTIPERQSYSWFEISDLHYYTSKRQQQIAEVAGYLEECNPLIKD